MSDNIGGYLEIGTNDQHEVVINLGEDRTGHVVFSVDQARQLAKTLQDKANAAAAAQLVEDEARRIASLPPVDRSSLDTTNGRPVEEVRQSQTADTGQHAGYIVLSAEERAKGFVRPYRDSYKHVGPSGPTHKPRPLTPEELERYPLATYGYVIFESYPESEAPKTGRFWTEAELKSVHKGCGTVTTMGRALSETYARDPHFYGATFCCGCNRHLPVAEFVWTADGERVGS